LLLAEQNERPDAGLGLVPTTLASLLAEATGEAQVPGLVSYGGVGILAIGLLVAVRELWAREKANSDHHRERAEKAEAEVRRLNDLMQTSTLPAVMKATELMGQLLAKAATRRGPP
jgi:hypothetical protein